MSAARILRTARRRAGMTQRALSDASGVPQSSIARIERGSSMPRIDTLQRLLRATGHDLEAEERLGEGVDRTLIRELLGLTADQRARVAVTSANNLARFAAQARIVGRATRH